MLTRIQCLIKDAIHHEKSIIKSVVQEFYDEVWNKRDKSLIPNILHSDFTFRGSLGHSKSGHKEFGEYVDFVHLALGEYRCDILDLIVEGDKAFARMRFSGTHQGIFFGHKPIGKYIEWAGAARFTFREQLVADLWVLGDVHGLIQLLERNAQ
jgi:predicted ester cyclase